MDFDVQLDNTYPHTTVADLFADGSPEVIADNAVLDGRTGVVQWQTFFRHYSSEECRPLGYQFGWKTGNHIRNRV